MADRFAEGWLRRIDAAAGEAHGLPVSGVIGRLRPEVRALMISFRDDGSWPETELLMELIQVVVEVVDATLLDRHVPERELDDADQRWLSACRQCTRSPELLEEMLAELRPDVGRAGYSGTR